MPCVRPAWLALHGHHYASGSQKQHYSDEVLGPVEELLVILEQEGQPLFLLSFLRSSMLYSCCDFKLLFPFH